MTTERAYLMEQIWAAQNEAYDLMNEYDSLPHRYGTHTLHQAEARIIDLVALHPNITCTELSEMLRKSPSACSQILRKLRAKGWIEQTRNESNNRLFNLRLTEEGEKVYHAHSGFEGECQDSTFHRLSGFSLEQLSAHLAIQRQLNAAYQEDVRRSREQQEVQR